MSRELQHSRDGAQVHLAVGSMSAEVLREAAALMRERAEKAEQGRWKLWGMTVMADPTGTSNVDDGIDVAQAFTPSWCERGPRTWNAAHIASWHPAVALAVANWLAGVADAIENWERGNYGTSPDQSHAFAVARAYLGEAQS
jgi:hypothetical protein